MTETKKPTESGKVELSESALEDVSGGPHFRTFDGLTPAKSEKKSTFISSWKVSGFDGKGND